MDLSIDLLKIDLSHLSPNEKDNILKVLKRDDELRKAQNDKYFKLKQEIDLIESRSLDIPNEHINSATVCVRCRESFGYFFNLFNQGEICPQCGYKVCQKCRINQTENGFSIKNAYRKNLWLCILCHKYNQYLVQTGDWIYNSETNTTDDLNNVPGNNLTLNPIQNGVNRNDDLKNGIGNNLSNHDSSKRLFKKNVSRQRSSSSNTSTRSNLTGSQIIKISLFPDKKDEILDEALNISRSTLNKRYSHFKKHKSQSDLKNDKLEKANFSNDSESLTPTSSRSSSINGNPTNQKNTSNVNSPTLSELASKINEPSKYEKPTNCTDINFKVKALFNFGTSPTVEEINQNYKKTPTPNPTQTTNTTNNIQKPVPQIVGDDFESVTSSEFDDTISNRSKTPERTTTNRISNESITKSDYFNKTTNSNTNNTNDNNNNNTISRSTLPIRKNLRKEISNTSNSLNYLNINNEKLNKKPNENNSNSNNNRVQDSSQNLKETSQVTFSSIFSREKSPSLNSNRSKKSNTDPDNDNFEIDKYVANYRESLRSSKKNPINISDTLNNTKGKQQAPQTNSNQTNNNTNSNAYREKAIDPEDEYLKSQLEQEKYDNMPLENSFNTSHHMSIMKRTKNALQRTVSIKSVDEYPNGKNMQIQGRIFVQINYEIKSSNLSVKIQKCENLSSGSSKKDTCNSYVKVYLEPTNQEKNRDKNMKRKTPVIKNNCDPEFDETLRYTLSKSDVDTHQLWISVWHKDTFGRNKFLGDVIISLKNKLLNDSQPLAYNLGINKA